MAADDQDVTALQALTKELRTRVEALERAFVVLFASLTGALMIVGVFLPFLTGDDADDDLPLFLFSAPFQALGYREDDGSVDLASTVIGSAFLLLLLVVGSAVFVLVAVVERSAGPAVVRWATTTGGLLLVGVVGMWIVIGMRLSNDDSAAVGPGAVVLSAGALAFALLVLPERMREWWTER